MRSIRWALLASLVAAGGLACADKPAWMGPQNPGSGCIDPCGAMNCPEGTHCAYNGQCQARCDTNPPPSNWKP